MNYPKPPSPFLTPVSIFSDRRLETTLHTKLTDTQILTL